MDRYHFQQHGTRYRMLVPPEDGNPALLHAPPRKSVTCFDVVKLRTGQFILHTCAAFNAGRTRRYVMRPLCYRYAGVESSWCCTKSATIARCSRSASSACTPSTSVPAVLQPPERPDRAGAEAGSTHGHPQSAFPETPQTREARQPLLRSPPSAEPGLAQPTLHWLTPLCFT